MRNTKSIKSIIKKAHITLVTALILTFLFTGCEAPEKAIVDEPSKILPAVETTIPSAVTPTLEPTQSITAPPVRDDTSVTPKPVREVDIYAINDLHGKFKDSDGQPGVDELTTYLKTREMLSDGYILLSSGDMWQGSSESNQTKGALITSWMNELNFSSMTLGNHEFDWGTSAITDNGGLAEFPFLGINVYDSVTQKRVDWVEPSVMVETNGFTIGIIGAVGDCYGSISSDKTKGIYFVTGEELTKLIKNESMRLRALGADFIIYSIHDGYDKSFSGTGHIDWSNLSPYYDIDLSDGYVDLCFEGHTHRAYVLSDIHGVMHIQGGGDNTTGIAHVRLKTDEKGKLKVETAEIIDRFTIGQNAKSPLVNELLEKYAAQIGDITSVIGTNDVYMGADELRQLAADLYYLAGMERWGEDYDIVLGGGFFSCRSPRCLYAGDVTYEMLQMLFPFDNEIVLCSIPGVYLNNNFFATTNDNYFISYGDYGEYVEADLAPNATYYIVTDTYSSQYEPNHLTVIDSYDTETFARDLLADYFSQK